MPTISMLSATFGSFIFAQTAPNLDNPFASLGIAGIVALVVYLWQRDTAKQRDRLQQSYEALTPVLTEVLGAIKQSNEAHKDSAAANKAAAAALTHIPTEEMWTRLRVALEQTEMYNARRARGE